MAAPSRMAGHAAGAGHGGLMDMLVRFFARTLLLLNSVGTVWIFLLMVVIVTDVIGRTAFTQPLPGVPELVSLSIVGIVFLQLPHTLRSGRITRIETLSALVERRVPRVGHLLQGAYGVLGALLFVALYVASQPSLVTAWQNDLYVGVEGYVTYPVWPVRLFILIGCIGCVLQYLLQALDEFRQVFGRAPLATLATATGPTA